MGKTFKDQKNYPRPRREREEPLSSRYISFMRYGPDEFIEESYFIDEDELKFDPGDFCPDCGEPTDFDEGYLCCRECGWIDSGLNDFDLEEAA